MAKVQWQFGAGPGKRLHWCAFCVQSLPSRRRKHASFALCGSMQVCIALAFVGYSAFCACQQFAKAFFPYIGRLRPPNDEAIYAVLVAGGMGGDEYAQWTLAEARSFPAPATLDNSENIS